MKNKGSMSEYIIVAGSIVASIILLISARGFILSGLGMAGQMDVESTAEKIVDVSERVGSEPSYTTYCIDIQNSNINIQNNFIEVIRDDTTHTLPLPHRVMDTSLENVNRICIANHDKLIIDETAPDCPPGENCRTAPERCTSDTGICCPEYGEDYGMEYVDTSGYTTIMDQEKGENCSCTNQCVDELNCNPTTDNFTDYPNACCPSGKSWDGTECVEMDQFILVLANIDSPGSFDYDEFKQQAEQHGEFFKDVYPLQECPETVKVKILEETCDIDNVCNILANDMTPFYDLRSCIEDQVDEYNVGTGISLSDILCPPGLLGASLNIGVNFAVDDPPVTAHEIGHEYGLNDEYLDVCSAIEQTGQAPGGVVPPWDSNCLEEQYDGGDPRQSAHDEYCLGSEYPTQYTVYCLGNKHESRTGLPGRDIMGYSGAPGYQRFAPPSYEYLKTQDDLQCPN